jgi:hypothetical protein
VGEETLSVKDQKIAGSFVFHLDYCPLSGGERTATVSIGYDNGKTFRFTVKGRGRPEEFKLSSKADMTMNKVWGGYNKNQDERPAGMIADSAGNMFFAGNGKYLSSDTFYYDIFVGRINADGSEGWKYVYHSKFNDRMPDPSQNDESGGSSNAICMDSQGFLYITGSVGNGSNSAYLSLIMKINPADGKEVWRKYWFADTSRLKFTDSSEAYAIDTANGMVFITGQGKDQTSNTQGVFVSAFSASDGSHIWSRIINPNGNNYNDRGHAIKADGLGNLIIAGWQGENTGSPFLAKLGNIESRPTLEWARNFNMGTGSNFNGIDVDPGGNIYLSADRRGATTYFSIIKVSPDGKQVRGTTVPGTAGGNNNTKVVKVIGDAVYAGGRIGISGLDTGLGDGMLAKFATSDLSLIWAALYYTGTGPQEVAGNHIKGIAANGSDLLLYGEVYTGNANNFRYYGYWYDLPAKPESYAPGNSDVSASTVMIDMVKAGLVDGLTNGGVYEPIAASVNLEYQDAAAKNEASHGSQVDGDVTFMRLKLR